MISINPCSQYANDELVKSIPKDAIFVPTALVALGGCYIKICKNNSYYRMAVFLTDNPDNYEVKTMDNKNVDDLLGDSINFLVYDDIHYILKLSGGKTLVAFVPDDTFYVETGENEARIRIQIVESGLYYATIYNVRSKNITYEGFMVDEKGRNADEAVKDPKKFRFAWNYIVLDGGYWLVKKILPPEEIERLKKEGKISYQE
jgi:hypothetical protein